MRRLLLVAFGLLPLVLFAQQITPPSSEQQPIDARLYAAFGAQYVADIAADADQFWLHRWTFYLDNAYFISETALSKDSEDGATYPSVHIEDLAKINIIKLEIEQPQLKRDFNVEKIYRIEGTSKFLVYYSGQQFIDKFNAYLNELKIKN